MDPITIQPLLYVLELEDECWYIGITWDLCKRWEEHRTDRGAKFTKLHKPVRVARVVMNASLALENEITLEYIEKYSKDKVKGGSYCKI